MKLVLTKLVFALFALTLLSPAAAAEEEAVTFGGERYVREPGGPSPRFTLPGKEIAFHHFPKASGPMAVAVEQATRFKTKNPALPVALMKKDDGSEAMLDYLSFSDDQARGEFHALKFASAGGKDGVLAVEYIFGFASGTLDADAVKKIRAGAESELAKFDMRETRRYFGLQ